MTTHEFWRERATGRIWAVKLLDGIVVGCFGPVDQSDFDERFLTAFDYSPERAGWVEGHRDDFDLCDPTRPGIRASR